MSDDTKFENLKNEFYERLFHILPEVASLLGLHDPYDHQLSKGDLSPDFEIEKLFKEIVRRMKDTINFDALNDANKIDWQVLENTLEMWKFYLHLQRQNILNPDAFTTLSGGFFTMISKDYAPLEERMKAILSRLRMVPRYLEEFRTRFEKSKPAKLWTEMALESAQQMPGLFQFIVIIGKGQIPDKLQEDLEKAVAALEEPLKEHIAWLQQLQANTIKDWALGKKRFEQMIQLRGLGMTSEEILHFGIQSLKELKKERRKLAAQIDPNKSFEEVMAAIEKDTPKTFEEVLVATRTAIEEAKQFIIDNDLATVFEEDIIKVEETPAYLAPLIPFAALIPPSRFDDPKIGIYLVTRPRDIAHLGKILNNPSIRNVAVHESFPGHFLQFSVSSRRSLVPLLGAIMAGLGVETMEGWAHYCEQMMMEKGFVKGLEAKMAQLTGAIWRAVRIILDVQLGRGQMTVDEAVNMLVKEIGIPKETALAEVRGFTFTPGYPLSYLLGKHLILQLREEIKHKMGDQYSDRFFHDTITANGNLPISLLRKVFEQKIAEHTL